MQLFEFRDPRWRKQIDARGEQLTQLHESWPEFLERETHALCGVEGERLRCRTPVKDLARTLQHAGNASAPNHVAQTVPDQDRSDFVQTREVPHRVQCFLEHRINVRAV